MIAGRYAKALLDWAVSLRMEDTIYEVMEPLLVTLAAMPDVSDRLASPMVGRKQKLDLICTAAGGDVPEEFERFILLVLRNHREHLIQEMALQYRDRYRALKGIRVATLTVASEQETALAERLKPLLRGEGVKRIDVDTVVDRSIEGGFIFQSGTFRADASVASQLRRVEQGFRERNRTVKGGRWVKIGEDW